MEDIIKFFNSPRPGVFLFTHLKNGHNKKSYLFSDPTEEIDCYEPGGIWNCFEKIEKALASNYFLAGFFSYELGYFLDDVRQHKYDKITPLIWLGVFDGCRIYDSLNLWDLERVLKKTDSYSGDYWVKGLRANVERDEYVEDIDRVKEYIKDGDIYQANYTFKLEYDIFGDIPSLFLDLNKRQRVSYSAYIKQGNRRILSLSPELFFRRDGRQMTNKPMKGTIKRSNNTIEDLDNKKYLENSDKNRAENLMIVDLVRNDLGRICEMGSVSVPRLFEVEEYETVYQMTSTICGVLRDNIKWVDIFKGLFPCGSVTGAPKIRSMQIIHELEKVERGVYTGAIGFISPKNEAVFNIPIRTLAIDTETGRGDLGIGSGIVIDSKGASEYEECILKAKYFTDLIEDYKLIETILWEESKGYSLLDLHMERLENSARFFRIPFSIKMIKNKLEETESDFCRDKSYKVRLLIDKKGEIFVSYSEFLQHSKYDIPYIAVPNIKTDPGNIFLYHKTTNRALYESEYEKYGKIGFVDVIFENKKGEITEGAITNVFVEKGGIFMTPPVECGLLDGVYRKYLLRGGQGRYIEKVLRRDDLIDADAIYLSNSVRGLFKVQLCEDRIRPQTTDHTCLPARQGQQTVEKKWEPVDTR